MSENPSQQTRYLHENELIRSGIYVRRESCEKFERALQMKNCQRAEDGKQSVSRTTVIQAFIEKWSERRLELE